MRNLIYSFAIIFIASLTITAQTSVDVIPSITKDYENYGNETATIHMIIWADTKDKQIGKSCDIDYENMVKQAQDNYSKSRKINLKTYYHKGAGNKKEELLEELRNLNVKKNDVVFFYFSGHGYRTDNSTSPYPRISVQGPLYQANQGVSVDKISSLIKKANPRMSLVLVDACNTKLPLKEPLEDQSDEDGSGFSGSSNKIKQLEKLFLEFKGDIIICASKAGDGNDNSGDYTGYSWSNKKIGGYFTLNFNTVLNGEIDKTFTSWESILSKTKNRTILFSKQKLKYMEDQYGNRVLRQEGNNVQIPVYEINQKK